MIRRTTSLLSVAVLSLALGALTSTGCKNITGGECDGYEIKCHTVSNGVEVVGGIVPEKCDCPGNTTFEQKDNVTPGGPYNLCKCK